MEKVYTSAIIPYTINGLIGLQKRGDKNKKNNENYAFFGGRYCKWRNRNS